jgi:hypothetical protein
VAGLLLRYKPVLLAEEQAAIVTKLCELTKPEAAKSKDQQRSTLVAEAAVRGLGAGCISVLPHPQHAMVVETLLKTSEAKSLELNMTAALALCMVSAGPCSQASADPNFPTELDNTSLQSVANEQTGAITATILEDWCRSTKAVHRHAAGVWLECILRNNGHLEAVQVLLPQVQQAFIELLGEGNDITQSLASTGLSLCYENGTGAMKEQLVAMLVETLSHGKRSKVRLTTRFVVVREN